MGRAFGPIKWLKILQTKTLGRAHQQRWVLTLQASQFAHILGEGLSPTEAAYGDDLLSRLTEQQRARILQRASFHAMAVMLPNSKFMQGPAGLRHDGSRRGRHQSEHDYLYDGRNVECKSTRMRWDSWTQSWTATWRNIKFDQAAGAIDDLVLALHSPHRVDVLLHDHAIGVKHDGVRTGHRGHVVCIRAERGLANTAQGRDSILRKLLEPPGRCSKIAMLEACQSPLRDLICAESACRHGQLRAFCYRNVALAKQTSSARALRLQKLAFEVDQILHPECRFQYGAGAEEVVGLRQLQRRGAARGLADWMRDSVRVEFKSSMLQWNVLHNSWLATFVGIKTASSCTDRHAFDELLLGLYSPSGLHVLKHSGELRLSSCGARTGIDGGRIAAHGPRGQESFEAALASILFKLEQKGFNLVAIVHW